MWIKQQTHQERVPVPVRLPRPDCSHLFLQGVFIGQSCPCLTKESVAFRETNGQRITVIQKKSYSYRWWRGAMIRALLKTTSEPEQAPDAMVDTSFGIPASHSRVLGFHPSLASDPSFLIACMLGPWVKETDSLSPAWKMQG